MYDVVCNLKRIAVREKGKTLNRAGYPIMKKTCEFVELLNIISELLKVKSLSPTVFFVCEGLRAW